jgi:hypothetical protein
MKFTVVVHRVPTWQPVPTTSESTVCWPVAHWSTSQCGGSEPSFKHGIVGLHWLNSDECGVIVCHDLGYLGLVLVNGEGVACRPPTRENHNKLVTTAQQLVWTTISYVAVAGTPSTLTDSAAFRIHFAIRTEKGTCQPGQSPAYTMWQMQMEDCQFADQCCSLAARPTAAFSISTS